MAVTNPAANLYVNSKASDANIELHCSVSNTISNIAAAGAGTSALTTTTSGPPIITTNTITGINYQYTQTTIPSVINNTITPSIIAAGDYFLSTQNLQKGGLQIAIEEFTEPRAARKAIQHTYQGIFIDAYDVAPPMLTVLYAVEMPYATNLKTFNFWKPKNNKPASLQTGSGTSTAGTTATTLATSSPAKLSMPNMSFVEMLNLIYLATSARNSKNSATLYFRDYTRGIHHQVSMLNLTYRAGVGRQNVLIAQLDFVVLVTDSGINTKTISSQQVVANTVNSSAPLVLAPASSTFSV